MAQEELFGVSTIGVGLALDGLKSTHPIFVPVEEASDIRGVFDPISYNKVRPFQKHHGGCIPSRGFRVRRSSSCSSGFSAMRT